MKLKSTLKQAECPIKKWWEMYRDEVVELMTKTIEDMNREIAASQFVPSEQVDSILEQTRPELMRVNGLLYDTLVDNGIIA